MLVGSEEVVAEVAVLVEARKWALGLLLLLLEVRDFLVVLSHGVGLLNDNFLDLVIVAVVVVVHHRGITINVVNQFLPFHFHRLDQPKVLLQLV